MKNYPDNQKEIKFYLHCALCIQESNKAHLSPVDYQQIEAGWTDLGLQIWCKRHDCNIVHIDFEGQQHPANTSRKAA